MKWVPFAQGRVELDGFATKLGYPVFFLMTSYVLKYCWDCSLDGWSLESERDQLVGEMNPKFIRQARVDPYTALAGHYM